MADDKMNPDNEKNLGGKMGDEGNLGQQSPGRNPNDDRSAGQRGGDRDTERKGQGDFDREGGGAHSRDNR
jgi:hypothetical protein